MKEILKVLKIETEELSRFNFEKKEKASYHKTKDILQYLIKKKKALDMMEMAFKLFESPLKNEKESITYESLKNACQKYGGIKDTNQIELKEMISIWKQNKTNLSKQEFFEIMKGSFVFQNRN